jgi:hypothetical protein
VLLDNKSAVVDRVLTLAEALVPMDAEMAEVSMTDEARNLLDAARARRDGLPPARERLTAEVKKMSTPAKASAKPGLRACRPKRAR